MTRSRILIRDNASGDNASGDNVSGDHLSRARRTGQTTVQEVTRLKRANSEEAGGRNELAWLLVLDNLVYAGDAESRWLDRIGARLARGATRRPAIHTRHEAGSNHEASTEWVSP